MEMRVRDFLSIVTNTYFWNVEAYSMKLLGIMYRKEENLSTEEVLEKYGNALIMEKLGGVELPRDDYENPCLCIAYETI